MQQVKTKNLLHQDIESVPKGIKFHVNDTHKVFSFSEIQKELKALMKEFIEYKSKMRVI